jgi:phage terminase large subunit
VTVAFQAADPVKVAEFVLGHDHWDTPGEILRAVFQPRSRVAVKACHASSKTFSAADAVLVALLLGGDVITTAPTWTQVEQVLWGAVHRAIAGGRIPRAEWGSVNRTEIRLATGEFAIGLSTDLSVRFQGYHARENSFLLVIFDEAPGVRPGHLRGVEGISAGGDVRLLLLGNPVIASGPFFDIFATDMPRWLRFTIDAFDTPNLRGLDLPGLLASDESESGRVSDVRIWSHAVGSVIATTSGESIIHLWQSRVRGQFPLQSDDALLSLAWLEAAARRPAAYDPEQPVQAGVDVAGPGEDETVLCVRQGDAILELKSWAQADPRGAVIAALNEWRDRGLEAVNVDVAGIGHYFERALGDAGLPVSRINVGEAPTGDNKRTTEQAKEKFANLRAQVFWSFREWAAEGMLSGLTDQTTLAQLAGIRYEHDNRGKVAIEKKADARKRGVKSPDRAEAVVLAFWKSAPKNRLEGVFAKAMAPTRPPITLDPNRPPGLTDAQWRYFEEQARRKRSEW